MLNLIYKTLKNDFLHIVRKDVEVGCNIYKKDNSFYIHDVTIGEETSLELPTNPLVIGTFHTHPHSDMNSWEFSRLDIASGVEKEEKYMFLLVDKDMYGIDMNRYKKSIENYRKKKIDIYKLAEIINGGKILFD